MTNKKSFWCLTIYCSIEICWSNSKNDNYQILEYTIIPISDLITWHFWRKKLAVFCHLSDVTHCTFFTFQLTLVSRGAACRHKLKFTRCLHQKNWILARQKKQTYIFLALETSFCIFSESTICHSCEKSRETVDCRVFRHYIFVSVWKKSRQNGGLFVGTYYEKRDWDLRGR